MDYQTALAMLQAIDGLGVPTLCRVPWNEPGIIGKVLDGGAYGVICPMVNTPQEAKNLVSYAKYPPKGVRSNGPIRAGMYGSAGTYQLRAEILRRVNLIAAPGTVDAVLIEEMLVQ